MQRTIPSSQTGLYWNLRGNVRCAHHAEVLDDRKWKAEAWAPLPASENTRVARTKRRYQCQQCSPDGNALGN